MTARTRQNLLFEIGFLLYKILFEVYLDMKKFLFVLPIAALLFACDLPFLKTKEPLKEPEVPETQQLKSIKSTKSNCGLTGDDSTEAFQTSLDIEGTDAKYTFEVGPNCYNHHSYNEFLIKPEGYFKSVSTYSVDRLVIDYFSGKGVNFEVLNASGEVVEPHESETATEYTSQQDKGAVLDYPINGTAWTIRNVTEFNKPAFYSVTVFFLMEK